MIQGDGYRFKSVDANNPANVIFEGDLIPTQCQGSGKNGSRCKRQVTIGVPFCFQHRKNLKVEDSQIEQAGKGLWVRSKNHEENEIVYRKNDFICRYNGEMLSTDQLDNRFGEFTASYAVQINDNLSEDASLVRGLGSLINNKPAREANCILYKPRNKKHIIIRAKKNIRNNNELFLWYGNEYLFDTITTTKYVRPVRPVRPPVQGNGLSSNEFKQLLKASYEPQNLSLDGWIYDNQSSSPQNSIFYNQSQNQAVLAIAGTDSIKDWANNAVFAIQGNKGYRNTKRYKAAEKAYNLAEAKYGKVIIIGHSQGGLAAANLGKTGAESITYNRATAPFQKNVNGPLNTNVRSRRDLVSKLNPTDSITLQGKKFINPLTNHSINRIKKGGEWIGQKGQ